MGIPGLATYISNHSDEYLQPCELRECYIVIDGNNIACNLYKWVSDCNSAFGGDYDKYAVCVATFFENLKLCDITPIVLLDGGYEKRKLYTVNSRLRSKISTAKRCTPHSGVKFFPLLMKDTFKDVLAEKGVTLIQCEFEADDEIAALARKLGCPVLSFDSDFFVYDVLYIPFTTLDCDPTRYSSPEDGGVKYYIDCKIYHVDHFLKTFGGLDRSLLPLMATLLGNDYIRRGSFGKLFSQIKLPRSRRLSNTQKQICGLLQWLRKETLKTAVEKVLGYFKKDQRKQIESTIERIIAGYANSASELLPCLGLSEEDISISVKTSQKFYAVNLPTSLYTSDEEDEADVNDEEAPAESSGEEEVKTVGVCMNFVPPKLQFPDWFKNIYCSGQLPTCFVDMVTLQSYFPPPQIENWASQCSHHIVEPIIRVIFGLLTADRANEDLKLSFYVKDINIQLKKFLLAPTYSCKVLRQFPPLDTQHELPVASRKALLLEVAGFSSVDSQILDQFPSNWQLYFLAVVYWARNVSEPPITYDYVYALLLGAVALNVVDSKVGYFRSRKHFLMKHGGTFKKLLKLTQTDKDKCVTNKLNGGILETEQVEVQNVDPQHMECVLEAFESVSVDDCLLLFDTLLPYHQLDSTCKWNPKLYSVKVVHAFAQFQSCVLHFMFLNALLNFPLTQCCIAKFFSGTLIYNFYTTFKKRSDLDLYASTLLKCAPSVVCLFSLITQSVKLCLSETVLLKKKKVRHKKKNRQSKRGETVDSDDNSVNDDGGVLEDGLFVDPNNKFSTLGTCCET